VRLRRRDAFTLVELLVVIAIISILAAMLLPALESALAQAHLAYCTNTQRQLYLATSLYADEHDGLAPASSYWHNRTLHFLSGLNRPLGTAHVYWQMALLYDLDYFSDRQLLIDPSYYTSGDPNPSFGDRNCLYVEQAFVEKKWQNRFLVKKGTVGTYVFYGYVKEGGEFRHRRLEPVAPGGEPITSILQCRTGGLKLPGVYAHDREFINSTYYDGHVRRLGGIAAHQVIVNKDYGNQRADTGLPGWWPWATVQDQE
jgi:prepilin-type N-terminal cleavage/methylation domain-containing protein